MAPRSRTGKLIQGLFGRFGKQQPAAESRQDYRPYDYDSRTGEFDPPAERGAARFDDAEETNWDDAETSDNENNPIIRPQQSVPAVTPPTSPTIPDPEDWDEALPAATVKNSNIQAARRRVTESIRAPLAEDVWDEDASAISFATAANSIASAAEPDSATQTVGLWTKTIGQFSRLLPTALRRFAAPILTTMIVLSVTVMIWLVDRIALPGADSAIAINPPAVVATVAEISPEQTFIEAIQTQFDELTSQYPEDLVQSLAVDFQHDRAIVQLDPVWYTLDDDRQDILLDRMWNQARANQLTQIEVQDTHGKTIARSPVVGRDPIVLQRRL